MEENKNKGNFVFPDDLAEKPVLKTTSDKAHAFEFLVMKPIGFEDAIQKKLDELAKTDEELRKAMESKEKSLEHCCEWICRQVASTLEDAPSYNTDKGRCVPELFGHDNVYKLARYYYIDPTIKMPTEPITHHNEDNPVDKKKGKSKNIMPLMPKDEKPTSKPTSQKGNNNKPQELSLFDF